MNDTGNYDNQMRVWENFKASRSYETTREWMTREFNDNPSLWAMYLAGWAMGMELMGRGNEIS